MNVFDTLEDEQSSAPGNVFDQVEAEYHKGKGPAETAPSSLSPVMAGGAEPLLKTQIPAPQATPAAALPEYLQSQFQQDLASRSAAMQQQSARDWQQAKETAYLPLEFASWLGKGIVGSAIDLMHGGIPKTRWTDPRDVPGGNIEALQAGREMPVREFISEHAKYAPVTATAANLLLDVGEMAPMAAMAGLPAWANRLIAAGFSIDMIAQAGPLARELGEEMGKPRDQRDYGKISRLTSGLIQSGVFAPAAGAGAIHRLDPTRSIAAMGLRRAREAVQAAKTAVTPEMRVEREQMLPSAISELGYKSRLIDDVHPDNKVAHVLDDGTVEISRPQLHKYLESYLAEGESVKDAIQDIVLHETTHSATLALDEGRKRSGQFWNDFTGVEKRLLARIVLGAKPSGATSAGRVARLAYEKKLNDAEYMGLEASRFFFQKAKAGRTTEMFGLHELPSESLKVKTLSGLLDLIGWVRQNMKLVKGTAAAERQLGFVDEIRNELEKAKKGAEDARSKQETAKVHGVMRAQPVKGARQVSVKEGVQRILTQAEGRVEEPAQILLTAQKDRSKVLLKDLPVVKDVPEGSIPHDQLIPAIRLINGDVVHGWVKLNGKVATHPQIAKKYGITVEEIDRKGFVDRAGKNFYEREPAAAGTQLPTERKEGELHSTDLPAKKEVPPAAPTEGGLPAAPAAVKAEAPVAPGAVPAISKATTSGEPLQVSPAQAAFRAKRAEVMALGTKVKLDDLKELARLRKAAGAEAPGLTMKERSDRLEEVKVMTGDELMREFPRGMNPENWDIGEAASAGEVSKMKEYLADVESKLSALKEEIGEGRATLDQMKSFQTLASKRQYFSEAIQAAPREVGGGGRIFRGAEERASARLPGVTMKEAPAEKPLSREELKNTLARIIPEEGLDKTNLEDRAKFIEQASDAIAQLSKDEQVEQLNGIVFEEEAKRQAELERLGLANAITQDDVLAAIGPANAAGLKAGLIGYLRMEAAPIKIGEKEKVKTTGLVHHTKYGPAKVLPRAEEPRAVKPRYETPSFTRWAAKVRDPILYPQLTTDYLRVIYEDTVPEVLANMSKAKLEELRTAYRLDKRFRGNIPEPETESILRNMLVAEPGTETAEFTRFKNATGLNTDQAMRELIRRKAATDRELTKLLFPVKTRKTKAGEEVGEAGREPLTEGEKNRRMDEWRKGRALDQKRREKLIGELHRKMVASSRPSSRNVLRRGIGVEDIDFSNSDTDVGAYREFSPIEEQNAAWLNDVLDEESGGQQIKTKRLAVLLNRKTGVVDVVSAYRNYRDGRTLLYDPDGPPGDKSREHKQIPEILGSHNVKSTILLADPVRSFHQRFNSLKEFNDAIGDYARSREASADGGQSWMDYNKVQSKKRAKLIEKQKRERFEEEEVAGAEKAIPGEQEALPEAEDPEAEIEFTRKRLWSELTDPDAIERRLTEEGEAASTDVEKIPSPLGREGRGLLNVKQQRMLRGPMTSREAEGIIGLFNREYELQRTAEAAAEARKKAKLKEPREPYEITQVKSPTDIHRVLEDIWKRHEQLDAEGNRRGYRGRDYAMMSGLLKATVRHYQEILKDPEVRSEIDLLVRDIGVSKGMPRRELHEQLKEEALGRALIDIYELAQSVKAKELKPGQLPFDVDAFRQKALERYGDTSWRDVEQPALAKERALSRIARRIGVVPEGYRAAFPTSERGVARGIPLPAEGRFVPLAGGMTAGRTLRTAPLPPEQLGGPPAQEPAIPERVGGITGIPIAGREAQKPFESRPAPEFPPVSFGRGGGPEVIPERYAGEYLRRTSMATYGRPPFRPLERPEYEQMNLTPLGKKYAGSIMKESVGRKPPEPEAPGLTMKQTGVARRVYEERVGQGRALPVEYEKEPISIQEMVRTGEKLAKDYDPEEVMVRVEQTGRFNWQDSVILRYWDRMLQSAADNAIKTHGDHSPQATEAKQMSQEWYARFRRAISSPAGDALRSLQGEEHIETGGLTGIRRELGRIKGRELSAEEDAEAVAWSEEIEAANDKLEAGIKNVDQEKSKANNPPLDQSQDKLVSGVKLKGKALVDKLKNDYYRRHPKGAPMAMKGEGGKAIEMSEQDLNDLAQIGGVKMFELSSRGELSDATWRTEMMKDFPDIGPHLDKIQPEAERFRNEFINEELGIGGAVAPARKRLTQKRPSVQESIDIVRRAYGIDPTGKRISTPEAFHTWNIIKQSFLERKPGEPKTDFEEILTKTAIALGTPKERIAADLNLMRARRERLYRALATKKNDRKLTRELWDRMTEQRRVISQAKNWLKNQEYPGFIQFIRRVPRWFFADKIFGHGTVGMITHASNMLFNPYAWKTYFPAWKDMYQFVFSGTRLVGGKPVWENAMHSIVSHERFRMWKKAGLQIDPFRYTDDYQINDMHRFFNKWTGGRGFDALKTLRLARAEQWWNSLPENLKTSEGPHNMASMIADSVNHATGIVKTSMPGVFGEASNWIFFAPKLELSRWAFLFKDTFKAMDIMRRWNRQTSMTSGIGLLGRERVPTMEEKAWALSELKQKALMVGVYYTLLAMNQGMLKWMGSEQDVNAPFLGKGADMRRGDFMSFKVAGFNVGVAGPMIAIVRMLADMIHIATGERKHLSDLVETRQQSAAARLMQHARGKLSPFASFAVNTTFGQDMFGRPLPWSHDPIPRYRRLQGVTPYGYPEWIASTFAPIPAEEAVKEVWHGLGMGENQAKVLWRSLAVAGSMAATGARVSEDQYVGR